MHVLHEDQQIKSRIPQGLHESGSRTFAVRQANGISLDAIVRQLPLFRRQPSCCQRGIRKQEDADGGNSDRQNTCMYEVSAWLT